MVVSCAWSNSYKHTVQQFKDPQLLPYAQQKFRNHSRDCSLIGERHNAANNNPTSPSQKFSWLIMMLQVHNILLSEFSLKPHDGLNNQFIIDCTS